MRNSLHRNESLPDDFWMGRFPVSVAQFEEFVKGGGYGSSELWPEAVACQVWREAKVHDASGARERPATYGEPYGLLNHPVVGVTWYEALAFVRWLQVRWKKSGLLPHGWVVSLPSESEWEKAARGGERVRNVPLVGKVGQVATSEGEKIANPHPRRDYPWGQWDASRLNFRESGIGASIPLGCFAKGASPAGCEEMVGNVWEWTRSQCRSYDLVRRFPYDPGRRMVRGGPFGMTNPGVLARPATTTTRSTGTATSAFALLCRSPWTLIRCELEV